MSKSPNWRSNLDPLADLFETMHVAGVVHARLEATAPWGLKREAEMEETAAHGTQPEDRPFYFAHFGVVSRGNCWLSIQDYHDPVPLVGGDCFLLAPGRSYALRDNPRTRARSFCEVVPRDGGHMIRYGGGGAPTTIVSGWFRFDPVSLKPLMRLLPPLILVKADQAQSLALKTTMDLLATEMAGQAPGSGLVVNRLADVLFIHCLRARAALRPESYHEGWLRAVFDPQIGAALKSMHDKVADPWTVESLAAACGMSRSAFALRFREMLGETPLEYLTNWRMHKAIALLRKSDRKLFDVARSVGYESEAAFSKAFKRILGLAPSEYNRENASSPLVAFGRKVPTGPRKFPVSA